MKLYPSIALWITLLGVLLMIQSMAPSKTPSIDSSSTHGTIVMYIFNSVNLFSYFEHENELARLVGNTLRNPRMVLLTQVITLIALILNNPQDTYVVWFLQLALCSCLVASYPFFSEDRLKKFLLWFQLVWQVQFYVLFLYFIGAFVSDLLLDGWFEPTEVIYVRGTHVVLCIMGAEMLIYLYPTLRTPLLDLLGERP